MLLQLIIHLNIKYEYLTDTTLGRVECKRLIVALS